MSSVTEIKVTISWMSTHHEFNWSNALFICYILKLRKSFLPLLYFSQSFINSSISETGFKKLGYWFSACGGNSNNRNELYHVFIALCRFEIFTGIITAQFLYVARTRLTFSWFCFMHSRVQASTFIRENVASHNPSFWKFELIFQWQWAAKIDLDKNIFSF